MFFDVFAARLFTDDFSVSRDSLLTLYVFDFSFVNGFSVILAVYGISLVKQFLPPPGRVLIVRDDVKFR
jgi:hypothetical protein